MGEARCGQAGAVPQVQTAELGYSRGQTQAGLAAEGQKEEVREGEPGVFSRFHCGIVCRREGTSDSIHHVV
jgi:hypothetical protein